MSTIYASFSDPTAAENASGALLDHGLAAENLSILVGEGSTYARKFADEDVAKKGITTTTPSDAATGALKGGIAGAGIGAIGLLASMFIPGVGLVLGGGALAIALAGGMGTIGAGVVAGTVVGYLKDQGVTEDLAMTYSTHLDSGGAILAVSVPSGKIAPEEVESLLVKYGAIGLSTLQHQELYGQHGVKRTEPDIREPSGMTFVKDSVTGDRAVIDDSAMTTVTERVIPLDDPTGIGTTVVETDTLVETDPLILKTPLPAAYADRVSKDSWE